MLDHSADSDLLCNRICKAIAEYWKQFGEQPDDKSANLLPTDREICAAFKSIATPILNGHQLPAAFTRNHNEAVNFRPQPGNVQRDGWRRLPLRYTGSIKMSRQTQGISSVPVVVTFCINIRNWEAVSLTGMAIAVEKDLQRKPDRSRRQRRVGVPSQPSQMPSTTPSVLSSITPFDSRFDPSTYATVNFGDCLSFLANVVNPPGSTARDDTSTGTSTGNGGAQTTFCTEARSTFRPDKADSTNTSFTPLSDEPPNL